MAQTRVQKETCTYMVNFVFFFFFLRNKGNSVENGNCFINPCWNNWISMHKNTSYDLHLALYTKLTQKYGRIKCKI